MPYRMRLVAVQSDIHVCRVTQMHVPDDSANPHGPSHGACTLYADAQAQLCLSGGPSVVDRVAIGGPDVR